MYFSSWHNWCAAEIDKGPQAIFTTCCGLKCPEIIPDDIYFNYLIDLKKRKLLSKWFIRNYVDSKKDLRWCPNSRCNKIIRFGKGGARDISCECGTRFCFACSSSESHSPAQCEVVQQWTAKNSSDKVRRETKCFKNRKEDGINISLVSHFFYYRLVFLFLVGKPRLDCCKYQR